MSNEGGISVTLDPKRVARRVLYLSLGIDLLMVYLDFVVNRRDLLGHEVARRLFNLVVEGTVGSWFGVTQTFLVGVVLWLIYVGTSHQGGSRWTRRGWGLLSAYFVYMAFDDGSFFHESVGQILHDWLSAPRPTGGGPGTLAGRLLAAFPSYAWEVFFVPVLGGLGVFMVVFSWRELRRRALRLTVLAAFLCLVVAVGLDFLEGTETAYPRAARALSLEAEPFTHYMKVLEEFLEDLATTLALYAFVEHLVWVYRDLRLRFVPGGPDRTRST